MRDVAPLPALSERADLAPELDPSVDLTEAEAKRENRRIWVRRTIAMAIVVLIAAPLTTLLTWTVLPKPPAPLPLPFGGELAKHTMLASAYRAYAEREGPSKRGRAFQQCATWLDQARSISGPGGGRLTLTDADVLACLGPPDLQIETADQLSGAWAYFYDQSGTKDGALMVGFTGPRGGRAVSTFAWTTKAASNWDGYSPFGSPTTMPAATMAPAANPAN